MAGCGQAALDSLPLMIPSAELDITHPAYRAFRDCVARGASWQDIYDDSAEGFGARPAKAPAETSNEAAVERMARREFVRIREHARDLVDPIARHYGLRNKQVLDFGCGSGALSVGMALAGAEVTALDPTLASLEATRHRATYFGVRARLRPVAYAPRPRLPFRGHSFDLVITNSVMEFIPTGRQQYVEEMIRVLKPGGLLVVSTENGLFPLDYYTRMPLPRLRRRRAQAHKLPYGLTWRELRTWARSRGGVRDLSPENRFNSIDKTAATLRLRGHTHLSRLLSGANVAFRGACRVVGLPSDIFLPYSTFVFEVGETASDRGSLPEAADSSSIAA